MEAKFNEWEKSPSYSCVQDVSGHMRAHKRAKPYSCKGSGRKCDNHGSHKRPQAAETPSKIVARSVGKSFCQRRPLAKHKKSHSEVKDKACDKTVVSQRDILATKSHTGEKPYSCNECGKTFSRSSHLVLHVRTHTGEKPYRCNACGKTFSTSSNLLRHGRVHTGEKPYSCVECGKTFSLRSHLKEHSRVHTGEKLYSCKECGKTFSSNNHLTVHTRVHTGEKPYSCNECGNSFSTSYSCRRHMRVHTGEKPFCCKECGKKFSGRSQLGIHMRTHTGEKPYSCRNCGANFSFLLSLQRHLQTHLRRRASRPRDKTMCLENYSSMDDMFSTVEDNVNDATNAKGNQLSKMSYDTSSCLCTRQTVATSLPDDFVLSPSVCRHANIAVVYDVEVVSSVSSLVMEKVETSLTSLLNDVDHMVTMRERVNMAFGIIYAVEYFHDHLRVPHGFINGDTVFVTQQLSAKLLDPSAAFLLTGKLSDPVVTFAGDIKQLVHLLLSLLSAIFPAFPVAYDRLQNLAFGHKIVDGKSDCRSMFHLKQVLDDLRQTTVYGSCPRGRQLLCQELEERT